MSYRCVLALVALSAAISTVAIPVAAEPPVTYVEAPIRTDPLSMAIRERSRSFANDASSTAIRRASSDDSKWQEQLAALYQARDGRPIWVGPDGVRDAARTAAAEIGRAEAWGLDATAFAVPHLALLGTDPDELADAELTMSLAVLKYAAHARGHRVDPSALSKWLDQRPRPIHAGIVSEIADHADPDAALRNLHPSHPQFERLRQAWLELKDGVEEKPRDRVVLPSSGRILRPGIRHEDVALLRRRLSVADAPDGAAVYDDGLVAAVRAFQRSASLDDNAIVNAKVRRALNGDARATSGRIDAKLILVNMERWRWLPDDLGSVHVWNNLPEFKTRVLRGGEVAFEERIIIGKAETQTPVFSDRIRFVVFKPEWGLPPSIKVKDLLPRLRDGDTDVLSRRGMKIVVNGREKDPDDINWSKVDIRGVPIVQESGSSNPLGQVKFMFPNRHDVYMHDTPSKSLFNQSQRTFSHGCIRVRDPGKLAELVFGMDRGWSSQDVAERFGRRAQDNSRVDLGRPIDVHNVYFTAVVDDDGSVRRHRDVYGHDSRIARALDGTPAEVIARDDPAVKHQESVEQALSNSGGRRREASRSRGPVSALDWQPLGRQRYRGPPPRPRYTNRGPTRYYYWGYN